MALKSPLCLYQQQQRKLQSSYSASAWLNMQLWNIHVGPVYLFGHCRPFKPSFTPQFFYVLHDVLVAMYQKQICSVELQW